MEGQKWLWGPALLRLFKLHSLKWRVVDELSTEELGSSVSDIMWTGSEYVIERECPTAWVAHDLSHSFMARAWGQDMSAKNWGLHSFRDSDQEAQASDLGLAILIWLHLPWRSCAWDLGSLDGVDVATKNEMTEEGWREVRNRLLKDTAKFKQQVLEGVAHGK